MSNHEIGCVILFFVGIGVGYTIVRLWLRGRPEPSPVVQPPPPAPAPPKPEPKGRIVWRGEVETVEERDHLDFMYPSLSPRPPRKYRHRVRVGFSPWGEVCVEVADKDSFGSLRWTPVGEIAACGSKRNLRERSIAAAMRALDEGEPQDGPAREEKAP